MSVRIPTRLRDAVDLLPGVTRSEKIRGACLAWIGPLPALPPGPSDDDPWLTGRVA